MTTNNPSKKLPVFDKKKVLAEADGNKFLVNKIIKATILDLKDLLEEFKTIVSEGDRRSILEGMDEINFMLQEIHADQASNTIEELVEDLESDTLTPHEIYDVLSEELSHLFSALSDASA